MRAPIRWHRVFHPLCGADPLTLLRLVAHAGPPSPRGLLPYTVALASSLARLPFTLAEAAWTGITRPSPSPPVFIIGFPRSGTTHLHNLLAASGCFATVPPVIAGMPWEARGLGRLLRPFIDPYLPEHRLIDGVRLGPDSPTEDEVALANMCGLSYFHALYFPRRFREDFVRGFLHDGAPPRLVEARTRALRRYVAAMSARDGAGRPLLLKNPAYTAQVGWLRALFPEARIIHIHRDPMAVFASNHRAVETVLDELALQPHAGTDVAGTILELYPAVMERVLAESARVPPNRFLHLAFEDLVAAPLPTLQAAWERLDLPEAEASLRAIAGYLATVRGYRRNPTRLPEMHRRAVEERWSRQLARFGPGGRKTFQASPVT